MIKNLVSEYRQKLVEDLEFKPLIVKLLQSTKKRPEFANAEDRIMYNFKNGIGIFSKMNKQGAKKLPPSIILNGLKRDTMTSKFITSRQ